MLNFLKKLFRKSSKKLISQYMKAGAAFGDAVSYSYMGEVVGMQAMADRLSGLERQLIERGYQTISVNDFVEYGGYGVKIEKPHLLEDGEEPIPRFTANKDINHK